MIKVGDKVKLVYSSTNAVEGMKRGTKSEKMGKVFYIHNNYITIQFKKYKGTIQAHDILADKPNGIRRWILYKRVNKDWVEVKEKDLTTRLFTEKNSTIKGGLTKWEW